MGTGGTALAVIVVAVLLGLIFEAFILKLSARLAGVEKRSFFRAIITVVVAGTASLFFTLVFSALPVIGLPGGFIAGLLIAALLMTATFDTTFGKALVATLLAWVLGYVVTGFLILGGLALVGGLSVLS